MKKNCLPGSRLAISVCSILLLGCLGPKAFSQTATDDLVELEKSIRQIEKIPNVNPDFIASMRAQVAMLRRWKSELSSGHIPSPPSLLEAGAYRVLSTDSVGHVTGKEYIPLYGPPRGVDFDVTNGGGSDYLASNQSLNQKLVSGAVPPEAATTPTALINSDTPTGGVPAAKQTGVHRETKIVIHKATGKQTEDSPPPRKFDVVRGSVNRSSKFHDNQPNTGKSHIPDHTIVETRPGSTGIVLHWMCNLTLPAFFCIRPIGEEHNPNIKLGNYGGVKPPYDTPVLLGISSRRPTSPLVLLPSGTYQLCWDVGSAIGLSVTTFTIKHGFTTHVTPTFGMVFLGEEGYDLSAITASGQEVHIGIGPKDEPLPPGEYVAVDAPGFSYHKLPTLHFTIRPGQDTHPTPSKY